MQSSRDMGHSAKERQALAFLEADRLSNMDMIFPIKRGSAEVLYAEPDGVFLKELESGAYMLTADSFEKARELLDAVGKQELYCVHQTAVVEYLTAEQGLRSSPPLYQAVYEGKKRLQTGSGALEIKPLSLADSDVVFNNYHTFIDLPYINRRLACGAFYGGFVEGELCGFIGTHEEGSIGMLEVFEGHKRKGFGAELFSFMTNLFLEQGLVPFGQIVIDNVASLALNRKLGYTLTDSRLYWVF